MIRRSISVMLAGGAALMLPGCVPTEMSGSNGNAETSIYYRSQAEADAALTAFDRDNPQCELWTNWQKMCVRKRSGARLCVEDIQRSVAPSLPFCVQAPSGVSGPRPQYHKRWTQVRIDATRVLRSATRFCRKSADGQPARLTLNDDGTFEPIGVCKFSQRRPFSTRNIADGNDLRRSWPIVENVPDGDPLPGSYAQYVKNMTNWCDHPGRPFAIGSPSKRQELILYAEFRDDFAPVLGAACLLERNRP